MSIVITLRQDGHLKTNKQTRT